MAGNEEAHRIVLESLTEALIQLMRQKPLADIKISELCEKAGVSRVSYYRNFESMSQILIQKLTDSTDEWWKSFSQRSPEEIQRNFWPELLCVYRRNANLVLLMYQNDLAYLIKEHIFECCGVHEAVSAQEAYERAAFAGALYGIVDEWIRRGMGDIPAGLSLRSMMNIMPTGLR